MPSKINRDSYAGLFGPTTGDRIRLADTEIVIEIEDDRTVYGDEVTFGAGKVIREGMGQSPISRDAGSADLVITNAVVLDHWGIIKGDIGVRDGRIMSVGKSGNPDIQSEVDIFIGPGTEIIAGEGKIVTAGGIDTHVHFISPQIIEEALYSGITSMLGGGTGPAEGSKATTCTPGSWYLGQMLRSAEGFPVNIGFYGKGNSSDPKGLIEQVAGGACGFKIHEDWGATPSAIDCCLQVADETNIQVMLHTDTLNESGFLEETMEAIRGRTIHAFHVEGAGGGHAPDMLKLCSASNIIPSSTTPTRPYTINTVDEHLDMVMVCHHLDPNIPEDVAFAKSRIRGETMGAEDILHDMGAISIINSDSQAMGRAGEVIIRTWQTADKMKRERGRLAEETGDNDNFRAKRYLCKYTINPAIAQGISEQVGSIEPGKLADLCIWRPGFFGVKPDLILKNGSIVAALMGDPNASIPTPQPTHYRPMFGAFGSAIYSGSVIFTSQMAIDQNLGEHLELRKTLIPVKSTRTINKRSMILNRETPNIEVDPRTYEVRSNGTLLTSAPSRILPMAQRYFLF